MKPSHLACLKSRCVYVSTLEPLDCLLYTADNRTQKNSEREGKMILSHCVKVLKTGRSEFVQANFTDEEKVFFKLLSGVSAKRLDSMKSALIMIEVMKEAV